MSFRVIAAFVLIASCAASPAFADRVDISFDQRDNPAAINGAEATNLYTAQGVRFPSRPKIGRIAGGGTDTNQVLIQGTSSGGPDPLPIRVVCSPLEISFATAMDVRTVRMRFHNRHLRYYTVDAYSNAGVEIDRYVFNPPSAGPPFPRIELYRDITVRASSGEASITRVAVNPPSDCFDLAVIDNLSFDTANPVVSIDPVPAPAYVYTAVEAQPEVKWSGRVNDVSVHPTNASKVMVTTESGGLWETSDGASTWRPVTSLPVFATNSVHHASTNPDVIIVTAAIDFQRISLGDGTITTSGGGVWISSDGGTTWSQPTAAVPSFSGRAPPVSNSQCPGISEAYAISEDTETSRIFVSTSCGVSYVDNIGTSTATWAHRFFTLTNNIYFTRRFMAIAALDGPGVILGGGDGAWYSDDNGATWQRSTTAVGNSFDIHGAAGISGVTDGGFLITGNSPRQLMATIDRGKSWNPVPGAMGGGGGCGGIAHIYSFPVSTASVTTRNTFFGNTCSTSRSRVTINTTTGAATPGTWTNLVGSHFDTRTMGFGGRSRSTPRYLGSDGGLDIRSSTGTWEPVGSGRNGINALQLYDVKGQAVTDTSEYRLAFGTQDNDIWSSDSEPIWPESQSTCCEGGGLEMSSNTTSSVLDRWTYYTCGACTIQISNPLLQAPQLWPGYATLGDGWRFNAPSRLFPDRLPGWYLQILSPSTNLLMMGEQVRIALTNDYGGTFFDIATPTEQLRGGPHFIHGGTIYQALSDSTYNELNQGRFDSFKITRLRTMTLPIFSSSVVNDPAMNGMGSIGHYTFQFQWFPVYDIDPNDWRHIIAPDVLNRDVKVSTDGGENWSTIVGLKDQITRSGMYDMANPIPWGDFSRSLASSVKFFPVNPDLVLMGLQQGGAYISEDGGSNWTYIENSDRIPNITDFEWKNANEIYLSSYGRGLWRINNTFRRLSLTGLGRYLIDPNFDMPIMRNILTGPLILRGNIQLKNLQTKVPKHINTPLSKAIGAQQVDSVLLVVDGYLDGINRRQKEQQIEDRLKVSEGASIYYFADTDTINSDAMNQALDSIANKSSFKPSKRLIQSFGQVLETQTQKKSLHTRITLPQIDLQKSNTKNNHNSKNDLGELREFYRAETEKFDDALPTAVGVAFKDGKLARIIYGEPLRHRSAVAVFDAPKGEGGIRSEAGPGPRIKLHSNIEGIFLGDGTLDGNRDVLIDGSGFIPETKLIVNIDGIDIAEIIVNGNGYFREIIKLRGLNVGPHQLSLRYENGKAALSEIIYTRHFDEEKERE